MWRSLSYSPGLSIFFYWHSEDVNNKWAGDTRAISTEELTFPVRNRHFQQLPYPPPPPLPPPTHHQPQPPDLDTWLSSYFIHAQAIIDVYNRTSGDSVYGFGATKPSLWVGKRTGSLAKWQLTPNGGYSAFRIFISRVVKRSGTTLKCLPYVFRKLIRTFHFPGSNGSILDRFIYERLTVLHIAKEKKHRTLSAACNSFTSSFLGARAKPTRKVWPKHFSSPLFTE